jgi:hypothetical protein
MVLDRHWTRDSGLYASSGLRAAGFPLHRKVGRATPCAPPSARQSTLIFRYGNPHCHAHSVPALGYFRPKANGNLTRADPGITVVALDALPP